MYDTSFAKKSESENSMTPGIFNAPINPTAFFADSLGFPVRRVVFSVGEGLLPTAMGSFLPTAMGSFYKQRNKQLI